MENKPIEKWLMNIAPLWNCKWLQQLKANTAKLWKQSETVIEWETSELCEVNFNVTWWVVIKDVAC